jgi:hypothetical protein
LDDLHVRHPCHTKQTTSTCSIFEQRLVFTPRWSASSSLHVSSKFITKKAVEGGDEQEPQITITTTTDPSNLTEIPPLSPPPVSKFRQLKDVMWVRECLEDLTAAEFALSVEQQSEAILTTSRGVNGNSGTTTAATTNETVARKKKRAVDYEKLQSQLTKRIEDMTCKPFFEKVEEDGAEESDKKISSVSTEYNVPVLEDDRGMGRYAYSSKERGILLEYVEDMQCSLIDRKCEIKLTAANLFCLF